MAHKEGFAENHLGDKILTSLFRPREGAVRAPCDRSHPSENQIFLHLSSLISLHMDICALSLIDLCDKESSSYRIASKEWCSTASLTEEEKAKVVTKGLCANHSRHPERLRPEISTPPAKRSKSDPSTTSPSRKITDFPGWVPISPPSSGCEKLCNGINNPDLEEFIKDKHGFVFGRRRISMGREIAWLDNLSSKDVHWGGGREENTVRQVPQTLSGYGMHQIPS